MTINCDKITKETIDLMFSLIDKSDEKDREHAVLLCEDKNGKIVHSNICVGSECQMPMAEMMKIHCPTNTKEIATFHTHARHGRTHGGYYPSPSDILSSATEDKESFCHGYSWDDLKYIEEKEEFVTTTKNVINCYNIKDRQLLELGNSAYALAQRGEIKRAKDEIVPKMLDRLRNLGYPEKTKDVIDIKCSMTKTRK